MSNIKAVFFGTPEFVIPVLEKLHENFNLVAVVTTPDAPVGRKYVITPSPVAKKAEEFKLPVLKPEKLDQKFIIENSENLQADIYVVASYGHIIPKVILDIPKHGSLNIHPSKLPKYRGPSPIQQTLLSGEKETAVTVIVMDEEVDHGPILLQQDFVLSEQDTFASLHTKMFQLGAKLLIEAIPDFIEGKLIAQEQNHKEATFTPHIKREDGYFDINNPLSSEQLDRMIRAYYPWPTAWTKWNGKIVKFLPDGLIQMEGKNPLKIKDFLNGYPSFPFKIN